MTTIAWDGTTLAGDTLGVIGNLKVASQKIFRLADGRLYGGCGTLDEVLGVRDWLNAGGDKPTPSESFAAMVIAIDGTCARLENHLVPMPIAEPVHAVGSGRDFAIAAMALGQTAADAVALAIEWDVWTGGSIDVLTLDAATRLPLAEVLVPGAHVAPGTNGQLGEPLPWRAYGPR